MDKIRQLLTITDSEGKVITFFDGNITLGQVIVAIVAVVLVAICWKVLKGLVKGAITLGVAVFCLFYFGITTPEQLKDTAEILKEKGSSYYEQMAELSENVKVQDRNIEICVNGTWINVLDIDKVSEGVDGIMTLIVDGESYTVDDETVTNLINEFK